MVRYDQTAIPSGVAKVWSLHEESLSDPNTQTIDIKSGIRAENLAMTFGPKMYKCLVFFILFCVYRFEAFQLKTV